MEKYKETDQLGLVFDLKYTKVFLSLHYPLEMKNFFHSNPNTKNNLFFLNQCMNNTETTISLMPCRKESKGTMAPEVYINLNVLFQCNIHWREETELYQI